MGYVVEQSHAARGRRQRSLRLDVVLEQNRVAIEQPARPTPPVDGAGLIERGGVDGDHSVDLRIHRMHPRDRRLGRRFSARSRTRSSRQHCQE
jgi:hypothetical protein